VRRVAEVTYAEPVLDRPLVPEPTSLSVGAGSFTVSAGIRLAGPGPVAELVRSLLGPATGFSFAEGTGGIELTEVADAALGPEGYRLSVTPDGISASGSVAGLRWAVQTLRQLLPVEVFSREPVGDARWTVPCVDILDVPHHAWRGALLDVAAGATRSTSSTASSTCSPCTR